MRKHEKIFPNSRKNSNSRWKLKKSAVLVSLGAGTASFVLDKRRRWAKLAFRIDEMLVSYPVHCWSKYMRRSTCNMFCFFWLMPSLRSKCSLRFSTPSLEILCCHLDKNPAIKQYMSIRQWFYNFLSARAYWRPMTRKIFGPKASIIKFSLLKYAWI